MLYATASWLEEIERSIGQTDPAAVAAGIAMLGIGAAVFGWLSWRTLYRLRLIEDTPTSKARSAHQGYVELEGTARSMAHSPIAARLSGLPCCWYRFQIEELQTYQDARGRSRSHWKIIDYGVSTETFWLEDDTGRVAVDPDGAEIRPRYRDVWHSRHIAVGIAKPTAFITGFLASRPATGQFRFTEERINRGDPLYAIGLLKNLGSHVNGPTLDERVRELLREWKRDQPALHERFDLNRDGKIDEKEWWLARRAARREAETTHLEQTLDTVEGVNLLTHPRDRRRPYIISAYTQRELLRRKRRRLWWYGPAFFVLGVISVWMYNVRFS